MGKFLKKTFWLSFFSFVGYFGVKLSKKIIAIKNITKTLPQYIENVVGEKPEFDLTSTMKTISLDIGFSKKTYKKLVDLETTVREYINDFYPVFPDEKVLINIYEKISFEPEETKKTEEKKADPPKPVSKKEETKPEAKPKAEPKTKPEIKPRAEQEKERKN